MANSRTTSDVIVLSDSSEKETTDQIINACAKAIPFIQENWGLTLPEDCRIYVMTSLLRFIFQSAPWHWQILLGTTLPLWYFRARRAWPYSAAWTQRYGRKVAIGIKPPRLWAESDKSNSVHMFVEEKDPEINLNHITCHEMVHACSTHLKLPAWLNEGIATVTVDRFLAKQTIREKTLELVREFQPKKAPPTYRELTRMRGETFAYHAVRGYWITRYLEEKYPGLLKRILSQPREIKAVEYEIAAELGMTPNSFWSEIDDIVAAHFEKK